MMIDLEDDEEVLSCEWCGTEYYEEDSDAGNTSIFCSATCEDDCFEDVNEEDFEEDEDEL